MVSRNCFLTDLDYVLKIASMRLEREPENLEGENLPDLVKELIILVVNMVFLEESMELVSEITKYRSNLCRHLSDQLPNLTGQPVNIARFHTGFKVGWQEWKKKGKQHEESSVVAFMN